MTSPNLNLSNKLSHFKIAHDHIVMRFPHITFMSKRQKATTSSALMLMYFPAKNDATNVYPRTLIRFLCKKGQYH